MCAIHIMHGGYILLKLTLNLLVEVQGVEMCVKCVVSPSPRERHHVVGGKLLLLSWR